MRLDFHFTPQLMFDAGLLQLLLEQDLGKQHNILRLQQQSLHPDSCSHMGDEPKS
jgi:hypothetical protein